MALTELQRGLMALLKAYELEEDEAVGVMLLLKETSHQEEMLTWIENNTSADQNEVIQAALDITKGTRN